MSNETTRQAWRELGFFCGRNDAEKEWRIVGSVKGLRKFAAEIRKYASNQANDQAVGIHAVRTSHESRTRHLASNGNH